MQTIFNQAWDLSAVRDFDPKDKNGFFRNTYRAYNCLMVIVCSFVLEVSSTDRKTILIINGENYRGDSSEDSIWSYIENKINEFKKINCI